MKLTKQQQNGLLLTLYIARAGRCVISEAARELKLSVQFLQQIAGILRRCGHLRSFRGAGGGFELVRDPSVGEIISSLGGSSTHNLSVSSVPERRALVHLLRHAEKALNPVLKQKIRGLNLELAAMESAVMYAAPEASVN